MNVKAVISRLRGIDSRDKIIYKNIAYSLGLKGVGIFISFFSIRVSLTFLSQAEYGVWLTILSALTWITILDLGFGNGLRNKLGEALAIDDKEWARNLVSTAYVSLGGIFLAAIILFAPFTYLIDWAHMLNIDPKYSTQIRDALAVSYAGLCILFVFKLLNILFTVHHKPAVADMLGVIAQAAILGCVLIAGSYGKGTIVSFAYIYAIVPIIVYIIASLVVFSRKYAYLLPVFSGFKRKYINDIANIGVKFFVIQLSGLVLYSTDNLIITNYFGAEEVTVYSIPYKYFSVITYGFYIVSLPYWSMTTTAFNQGDYKWIQKGIKKLLLFWGAFTIGGTMMLILSKWAYHVWLGDKLQIPWTLNLVMLLYVTQMNLTAIYNTIIYGIGKVNFQVILSIAGIVLHVPITIALIKFTNLHIYAVPLAAVAYSATVCVFISIQVYRILNNGVAKQQQGG